MTGPPRCLQSRSYTKSSWVTHDRGECVTTRLRKLCIPVPVTAHGTSFVFSNSSSVTAPCPMTLPFRTTPDLWSVRLRCCGTFEPAPSFYVSTVTDPDRGVFRGLVHRFLAGQARRCDSRMSQPVTSNLSSKLLLGNLSRSRAGSGGWVTLPENTGEPICEEVRYCRPKKHPPSGAGRHPHLRLSTFRVRHNPRPHPHTRCRPSVLAHSLPQSLT